MQTRDKILAKIIEKDDKSKEAKTKNKRGRILGSLSKKK